MMPTCEINVKDQSLENLDMFEENEKHPMRITQDSNVQFPPDDEIDASLIDFSNSETLHQALDDLRDAGVFE